MQLIFVSLNSCGMKSRVHLSGQDSHDMKRSHGLLPSWHMMRVWGKVLDTRWVCEYSQPARFHLIQPWKCAFFVEKNGKKSIDFSFRLEFISKTSNKSCNLIGRVLRGQRQAGVKGEIVWSLSAASRWETAVCSTPTLAPTLARASALDSTEIHRKSRHVFLATSDQKQSDLNAPA